MNNGGPGLAPLGVEGVFGRDPSLDLVGVPGTGVRDECAGALVVRIRDSVERAALYFFEELKTEGGTGSFPETTERGRLGVNGVKRASLEVEGVSIIMVTVGSLWKRRWVLPNFVLALGLSLSLSLLLWCQWRSCGFLEMGLSSSSSSLSKLFAVSFEVSWI